MKNNRVRVDCVADFAFERRDDHTLESRDNAAESNQALEASKAGVKFHSKVIRS